MTDQPEVNVPEKDLERKKKRASAALVIIGILCLLFCAVPIHNGDAMEYRMPDIEINAEPVPGSEEADVDFDYGEFGAVSTINCSENVTIYRDTKAVEMLLVNPSYNSFDTVCHLMVDGKEVYTTGRIPIGYRVHDIMVDKLFGLPAGDYEGSLLVDAYHPKTGEKAMVSLSLALKIHVKDSQGN